VNGISVGNCLNDEDFLVQPSQKVLDGQSPAGVNFTLTLYNDAAAAKAAFDKKNPKTTALVENGVIDFRGNPSIFAGAPPAKISQSERSAIKKCIDSTRASG
jgi:poly-gamma-glutamate capsule biosynthesis protein CapA/YwtB (metallophosphatase superfamily)